MGGFEADGHPPQDILATFLILHFSPCGQWVMNQRHIRNLMESLTSQQPSCFPFTTRVTVVPVNIPTSHENRTGEPAACHPVATCRRFIFNSVTNVLLFSFSHPPSSPPSRQALPRQRVSRVLPDGFGRRVWWLQQQEFGGQKPDSML